MCEFNSGHIQALEIIDRTRAKTMSMGNPRKMTQPMCLFVQHSSSIDSTRKALLPLEPVTVKQVKKPKACFAREDCSRNITTRMAITVFSIRRCKGRGSRFSRDLRTMLCTTLKYSRSRTIKICNHENNVERSKRINEYEMKY